MAEPLEFRPTGAPPLEAATGIAFVDAELADADETAIERLTVEFGLDMSTLPGDTTAGDIAVYRQDGESWEPLEVTVDADDEQTAVTANATGVSTLALAAETVDDEEPADDDPPETDDTDAADEGDDDDEDGSGFGVFVGIAAVVVAALVAARRIDRR